MTDISLEVSITGPDAAWDDFVARIPGGDHAQASGWGETKRASGLEVVRLVARRSGAIVGGAQILIRQLPMVGSFGYVPRGPVLEPGDVATAEVVVSGLRRVAGQRRIRHLVVQPARYDGWLAERLPAWGLAPSALAVAPTATVVLDLSSEGDDLMEAMSRSTRKHIRRAGRSGVQLRNGTASDLPVFYELLAASAARHGFRVFSLDYYESMWRALHDDGNLALFLAEVDGEAVSAHLAVTFGDVFVSKVSAWSGRHGDLRPNELLEWHVISAAQAAGFSFYDFEGFDRSAAELIHAGRGEQPQRSADTFKLKFGGSVVLLPEAYDYFPSALLRHTYGRAYRVLTANGWPRKAVDRLRFMGSPR